MIPVQATITHNWGDEIITIGTAINMPIVLILSGASKKIKTDELGINTLILWTCRAKNISKNQNLYPQQSQITFYSFGWDTLY